MPIVTSVQAEFAGRGVGWTDITDDLAPVSIRARGGITGDGVNDRVAGTGTCQLSLLNNTENSAETEGYYSPDRPEKRAGFDYGIRMRVILSVGNRKLCPFIGIVDDIQPESGPGRGYTNITLVDFMEEAATRQIGQLELQEGKRGDELFQIVVNAMPLQPDAIEIAGEGAEEYAFAFDTSPAESTGLRELQRIAQSGGDYIYLKSGEITDALPILTSAPDEDGALVTTSEPHGLSTGDQVIIAGHAGSSPGLDGTYTVTVVSDTEFVVAVELSVGGTGGTVSRDVPVPGTLCYEPRSVRARNGTSVATFTDQELRVLNAQRSRPTLINRIIASCHPRRFGPTNDVVLWEHTARVLIPAGSSKSGVVKYRDPESQSRVGGTEVSAVLDANTASDGGGIDLSGSMALQTGIGSAGANWTIANPTAQSAFCILRFVGRPIFDFQTIDKESIDEESIINHGERSVTIDMPFQDSEDVTQDFADWIKFQYSRPRTKIGRVGCTVGDNDADALRALLRQVGHRITITESKTGIDSDFFIQSIELDIHPGPTSLVDVTYSVLRADSTVFWFVGVPGASEIGQTNRLAFAFAIGHTDLAHADSHGDSEHDDVAFQDVEFVDTAHGDSDHGDVAHGDVAHGDTHGDVTHSDGGHQDTSHGDSHSDVAHGDAAHDDQAFSDTPHVDEHVDVDFPAHGDGHVDTAHGDTPHGDSHTDAAHSDGHGDTPHTDHPFGDTPHSDSHGDNAHSDSHADQGHIDEEHGDVSHEDVNHQDEPHADSHGDVDHGDAN